jgi:hypothetical protein
VPQLESQLGQGMSIELDNEAEKQPGKETDEKGDTEVKNRYGARQWRLRGEAREETDIADGESDTPGAQAITPGLGRGEDEETMGDARVLAAGVSPKSWPGAGKSVTRKYRG